MESVALRLSIVYDSVAPIATPDHRIIANGAALLKSDLLLQIVTDALGRPVFALDPSLEASARGAALLALDHLRGEPPSLHLDPVVGLRPIQPDPERTAAYLQAREQQEQLRWVALRGGFPIAAMITGPIMEMAPVEC